MQCHAFEVPIEVYSAQAPVLEMGKEYGGHVPPVRLR
jgi:hypothetical protein